MVLKRLNLQLKLFIISILLFLTGGKQVMLLEKADLTIKDTMQFAHFIQFEASHKSLEDYFVQYSMAQNTKVHDFYWNKVNLRHVKFENMIFENGEIHYGFINESVLRNVTFRNIHFTELNMDETDFDNVTFENCTFGEVFSAWDVDLAKIKFINSKAELISFTRPLGNIYFEGCDFKKVDLASLKDHSSIEAKNCKHLKLIVGKTVLDKCHFEKMEFLDVKLSSVDCPEVFLSAQKGQLGFRRGKANSVKVFIDKLEHVSFKQSEIKQAEVYSKTHIPSRFIYLKNANIDKFHVENMHAKGLELGDAKIKHLTAKNLMLLSIRAADAEIGYFHLENVKVNGPIDYTNLQVDEIFIDKTRHLGSGTAEGALIKKGTRLGLYEDEPSKPYYLERVRGPHVYGILNK